MADAFEQYIAKRLDKPGTIAKVRSALRTALALWADKPVSSITEADAKLIVNEAELRGPEARNSTIRSGSAFFGFCGEADQDYIRENVFARFKIRDQGERDRVLSDAEVVKFWQGCTVMGPIFGPMFKTMLLTGARRSEVAGMMYSELNIAERLWTIPKGRTKNGASLDVYLTDQMLDVLNSTPKIEDCDFVFSANGTSPSSGFSKAKTVLDKLTPDLAEWNLHDLRRTMRTGLARLGVGVTVGERCVNHKVGGVEEIYDKHKYSAEMADAWSAWSAYVVKLTSATD